MSELTTLFKNTADAIRSKTGDTATIKASQFPAKIQGISVGISQDEADARYLKLSGGTMTGDLKVQKSPASTNSAVSKSYAQELFASALPKSGGTMTGALILNGAPTANNQAATKAYVDSKAGGLTLLAEKTITTNSDVSTYDVDISDLFSSISDYKSELYLGLEFNGTMVVFGGGATNMTCAISPFSPNTTLNMGDSFFQANVTKGNPLSVSFAGIRRMLVIPTYSSTGVKLSACIDGGTVANNLVIYFRSYVVAGATLTLNSGATITTKIYRK